MSWLSLLLSYISKMISLFFSKMIPVNLNMNCLITTLLLFSILSSNTVPSSATGISYSDHCSLMVREANPRRQPLPSIPLGHRYTGYRGGDNGIFGQSSSSFLYSFTFQYSNAWYTDTEDVIRVEATLEFPRQYIDDHGKKLTAGRAKQPGFPFSVMPMTLLRFWLEGFWSESSGKLCMVGSNHAKPGDFLDLKAVLKLENVKNSGNITSLISGALESLSSANDSNYFGPVSILMFHQMNYEYSLLLKEQFDGMNQDDKVKRLPLDFMPDSGMCVSSWVRQYIFNLKYANSCDSVKNCSPLTGYAEDLPNFVSLTVLNSCLNKERKHRVLLKFSKTADGFNDLVYPDTTLVGEGYWGEEEFSAVACRFVTRSLSDAHFADCSTRLSFWIPAKLSIRETDTIVGRIWTTKSVNDSGYFDRILLHEANDLLLHIPDLEYEYTEIVRARKLSLQAQPSERNGGKRYPNSKSVDMKFDIIVTSGKSRIARGQAIPFSVGDEFFRWPFFIFRRRGANLQSSSLVNISYKIGMTLLPDVKHVKSISLFSTSPIFDNNVKIFAEGIYNEETGELCMVGCRNLGSTVRTDAMDCEILLKFQLPPLQGNESETDITGSIESTRKSSDPLHFTHLKLYSAAIQAREYNWRMDREVTIALVSNLLACIFICQQHLHVKMHPEVLPSISTAMVLIIALGHTMPLMRNFEPMHLQTILLGGEAFEVNGVIIGIIRMITFSLQFRLVQLIWSSRLSNDEWSWLDETAVVFFSIPVYVTGAIAAMIVKGNIDIKSYAGFILNGFLVPQILLNISKDSNDESLCRSFYIGTTFLQVLPLAHILPFSNIYRDASSPWEVFVLLWSVVFAVVIFLQQKFGGSFMLPPRYRERDELEQVPVVDCL